MYAKVFAQIFDSSIAEDYQTRHVFMDLLVLADPQGVVDMTLESIARRTNVPIKILRASICKLLTADVNSRTATSDGRRLIPIDEGRAWGWRIVNFTVYHGMKDENSRREYMRTYMRKRRACKHDVNAVNAGKPSLAHEDVDVDVDVNINQDPPDKPAEGVDASLKEPMAGKQTKAGKTRAAPKPRPRDAYADAFKAAFDEAFPGVGGYAWPAADFVQLAKWREAHPGVEPEQFVEVARWHWGRGQFAPGASKTIRGLCSNWESLASAAGDGDDILARCGIKARDLTVEEWADATDIPLDVARREWLLPAWGELPVGAVEVMSCPPSMRLTPEVRAGLRAAMVARGSLEADADVVLDQVQARNDKHYAEADQQKGTKA